jgi:hypothetical protein
MAFVIPKWRAHNVADWESLLVKVNDGRRDLNPVTEAILNNMPVIGITEITAGNAVEAWLRISLMESVYGALITKRGGADDGQPLFTTKDDVIRHVGIETEGAEKTFAEFYEQTFRRFLTNPVNTSRTAAYLANGGLTLLELVQGP